MTLERRTLGSRQVSCVRSSLSLAIVVVGSLLALCGVAEATTPPPNFVVIMTDDQRFDSMAAMPVVMDRLASTGASFTNSFVTLPVCGPSRATQISGGYRARSTGVLTNDLPNGGVESYEDYDSIGLRLQQAGYETAFIGKYINVYTDISPHVPPGWSTWVATRGEHDATLGSSGDESTLGTEVSIQGWRWAFEVQSSLDFIDGAGSAPFLLMLFPFQPHFPAPHTHVHNGEWVDYEYRERGYGEQDLSDKPAWVSNRAGKLNHPILQSLEDEDEFHRDQLRAISDVDDGIEQILDRLEANGQLANTVVFFTSDNGLLWGEHQLFGKAWAYEESIRVPLIVSGPGIAPRTIDESVASDIDIGATIQDLAGLPVASDGLSLGPLLQGTSTSWREELVLQNYALSEAAMWAALRVTDAAGEWKYVEYSTGETELYDLVADPYELESLHADPGHAAVVADLAGRLAGQRGLAITTFDADETASLDEDFGFQLESWGGTPPLQWTVSSGALPSGVALDPATGLLSGRPVETGDFDVEITVEDSSVAPQTGLPERFTVPFSLAVEEGGIDVVTVLEATFTADPGLLVVTARSSAGGAVKLRASGTGVLRYEPSLDIHSVARARTNAPVTVVVTSTGGGEASLPVTVE